MWHFRLETAHITVAKILTCADTRSQSRKRRFAIKSRMINARLRVIFFVPADSCSLQREALAWLILLGGLAGMSPSSELRSGAWLPGSLAGWLRGTTRQSPLEGVSFRAPHCYRPYGIVRKQTNGEFALDEREHICNH